MNRRQFLFSCAGGSLLARYHPLAAAEKAVLGKGDWMDDRGGEGASRSGRVVVGVSFG